jgi:protein-disulfide isomerase
MGVIRVHAPGFAMLALALIAPGAPGAQAEEPSIRQDIGAAVRTYLREHPEALEAAVRDALARNPKLLGDAFAGFLLQAKKQGEAKLARQDIVPLIRANAEKLFASRHQVTLGNADGKRVLVEFFDYNCGFCRRAHRDIFDLMADDPDLKVVLKELPVLGPGSVGAAEIAIAVRLQDEPSGALYARFHRRMMALAGPADRGTAREIALSVGADALRLTRDLEGPGIQLALAESRQLAQLLGITGTPSYIAGERLLVGAVGVSAIRRALVATD